CPPQAERSIARAPMITTSPAMLRVDLPSRMCFFLLRIRSQDTILADNQTRSSVSLEHLLFITRRSRVVHIAKRRRSRWEPLADLPSDASELARATPDALVSAGSFWHLPSAARARLHSAGVRR